MRNMDNKTNPFDRLVGRQLTAATFVMDYLKFQFEDPVLTAMSPVTIHLGAAQVRDREPVYAETLRQQIGKAVSSASLHIGLEIRVEFEDKSAIVVSLDPKEYEGEEFAIFEAPPEGLWVWRHE